MSEDQEVVSLDDANSIRSKNWTIKNVPLETRLIASTAAQKAGQPMGQWLSRAVKLLADREAGNQVIPPGPTRANNMNPEGLPAVVGVGQLGDLAVLVQMAALLTPEGKRTEVAAVARRVVLRELQDWQPKSDL